MAARVADHVKLRRDLQVEIFLGTVATILALGLGFFQESQTMGLFWFATAASFGVATVGVWFAKEWARWTFGVLAVIVAAGNAGNVIMNFTASVPVYKVVGWIVLMMMWGGVAVRMLQARTRQCFAAARGAILRTGASTA